MTACPIRYQRQVSDRNGKIFYTSIASLSHISKQEGDVTSMDIFKLGDKILALLEMVFGFWNNQISLVFSMLGQSPVSFNGDGPWAIIEGIEPIFVAVGSSLVVLFLS